CVAVKYVDVWRFAGIVPARRMGHASEPLWHFAAALRAAMKGDLRGVRPSHRRSQAAPIGRFVTFGGIRLNK
ncbi:hypothetical protein ACXYUI_33205, partial [Klebsiella pneumoniae]